MSSQAHAAAWIPASGAAASAASAPRPTPAELDVCDPCLRRTWLVAALSPYIDQVRDRYGRPDELLALDDRALVRGLAGDAAGRFEAAWEAFDADAARTELGVAGLAAVCRHAAGYPPALLEGPAPPAVLHVLGSADVLEPGEPAVAIVGARRCTEYGRSVARSLARGLAAAGVPVVSGMALGVDAAAHEGALEARGPTVAVLGCGADVSYPATLRRLHARLRGEGAVVSELPPGFRARRWCFPVRNRIIAGLAQLTIVVEGGERSGSLITARLARDLGREVGAVPGRVTQPTAAGPNALLYDGAHVIRDAQDALDVLFGAGARAAPPSRDTGELPTEQRRVLRAVAEGHDTLARLAATGVAVDTALAALAELELRGHVRRSPSGAYTAVP